MSFQLAINWYKKTAHLNWDILFSCGGGQVPTGNIF